MKQIITIGSHKYRVDRRLDAIMQFNILSRIAPALSEFLPILKQFKIDQTGNIAFMGDPLDAIALLADGVSKLSDEAREYIVVHCLETIGRAEGDLWSPVAINGVGIAYSDLVLPDMLQLVWIVINENLSGFFPSAPPISGERSSPVGAESN